MIRRLILNRLNVEERKLGQSLDYIRHMVRVSLRAFFKFVKFIPLASYRRVLPVDAFFVAQLVAVRHEDCGPCVQIEVNRAKNEGVAPDIIRTVLAGDPDSLPKELADVYRFTKTVVQATGDDESLRGRIRQHYGEEGLIELALAIASCRVFPTTKRALGYARSCRLVEINV